MRHTSCDNSKADVTVHTCNNYNIMKFIYILNVIIINMIYCIDHKNTW